LGALSDDDDEDEEDDEEDEEDEDGGGEVDDEDDEVGFGFWILSLFCCLYCLFVCIRAANRK